MVGIFFTTHIMVLYKNRVASIEIKIPNTASREPVGTIIFKAERCSLAVAIASVMPAGSVASGSSRSGVRTA